MDFGTALSHLKAGAEISRKGWNGKNMFVYLNKGSVADDKPKDGEVDGIRRDLFDTGHVGTVTRLPNINMRSASGSMVTGWLASQTDMLAEDWDIAPAPTPELHEN